MTQFLKDVPLIRVLFVCMGNICRSPAAEVILHNLLDKAGLDDKVQIDSAGTVGYHEGAPPDARMERALAKRGYSVEGSITARRIQPEDLEKFDLIVTMDEENLQEIKALDTTQSYRDKIKMLSDFFKVHRDSEVPDPYYGGIAGFDYVVDLLEDGCQNLFKDIIPKISGASA